jgi:hypothetical protein
VLRFSDARNFGRTGTALALIVGPLLLLISEIVSPNTDHKNKLRELAAVASHKGTYLLSGVLWLAGSIVLMLAAIGLVKLFRGPRGVTLGQIAGVLLLFGSAVSFAWYAFGTVEYEMVNQKGLDRGALAAFLHKADNTVSSLPLFITFIAGIVLAVILLGIAAWRTRIVPRWVAALLIIEGPVTFVSNGKVASIVSFAILIVALGSIARRAWTMSDEEWDSPHERWAPAPQPDSTGAPTPAPAV